MLRGGYILIDNLKISEGPEEDLRTDQHLFQVPSVKIQSYVEAKKEARIGWDAMEGLSSISTWPERGVLSIQNEEGRKHQLVPFSKKSASELRIFGALPFPIEDPSQSPPEIKAQFDGAFSEVCVMRHDSTRQILYLDYLSTKLFFHLKSTELQGSLNPFAWFPTQKNTAELRPGDILYVIYLVSKKLGVERIYFNDSSMQSSLLPIFKVGESEASEDEDEVVILEETAQTTASATELTQLSNLISEAPKEDDNDSAAVTEAKSVPTRKRRRFVFEEDEMTQTCAPYFEHQDNALACGRHALNHLLGRKVFVIDSPSFSQTNPPDILNYNSTTPMPTMINSIQLCQQLSARFDQKDSKGNTISVQQCRPDEFYTNFFLIDAARLVGLQQTKQMSREKFLELILSNTKCMGLLNLGNLHWTAFVVDPSTKTQNYFDSLMDKPECKNDAKSFHGFVRRVKNVQGVYLFEQVNHMIPMRKETVVDVFAGGLNDPLFLQGGDTILDTLIKKKISLNETLYAQSLNVRQAQSASRALILREGISLQDRYWTNSITQNLEPLEISESSGSLFLPIDNATIRNFWRALPNVEINQLPLEVSSSVRGVLQQVSATANALNLSIVRNFVEASKMKRVQDFMKVFVAISTGDPPASSSSLMKTQWKTLMEFDNLAIYKFLLKESLSFFPENDKWTQSTGPDLELSIQYSDASLPDIPIQERLFDGQIGILQVSALGTLLQEYAIVPKLFLRILQNFLDVVGWKVPIRQRLVDVNTANWNIPTQQQGGGGGGAAARNDYPGTFVSFEMNGPIRFADQCNNRNLVSMIPLESSGITLETLQISLTTMDDTVLTAIQPQKQNRGVLKNTVYTVNLNDDSGKSILPWVSTKLIWKPLTSGNEFSLDPTFFHVIPLLSFKNSKENTFMETSLTLQDIQKKGMNLDLLWKLDAANRDIVYTFVNPMTLQNEVVLFSKIGPSLTVNSTLTKENAQHKEFVNAVYEIFLSNSSISDPSQIVFQNATEEPWTLIQSRLDADRKVLQFQFVWSVMINSSIGSASSNAVLQIWNELKADASRGLARLSPELLAKSQKFLAEKWFALQDFIRKEDALVPTAPQSLQVAGTKRRIETPSQSSSKKQEAPLVRRMTEAKKEELVQKQIEDPSDVIPQGPLDECYFCWAVTTLLQKENVFSNDDLIDNIQGPLDWKSRAGYFTKMPVILSLLENGYLAYTKLNLSSVFGSSDAIKQPSSYLIVQEPVFREGNVSIQKTFFTKPQDNATNSVEVITVSLFVLEEESPSGQVVFDYFMTKENQRLAQEAFETLVRKWFREASFGNPFEIIEVFPDSDVKQNQVQEKLEVIRKTFQNGAFVDSNFTQRSIQELLGVDLSQIQPKQAILAKKVVEDTIANQLNVPLNFQTFVDKLRDSQSLDFSGSASLPVSLLALSSLMNQLQPPTGLLAALAREKLFDQQTFRLGLVAQVYAGQKIVSNVEFKALQAQLGQSTLPTNLVDVLRANVNGELLESPTSKVLYFDSFAKQKVWLSLSFDSKRMAQDVAKGIQVQSFKTFSDAAKYFLSLVSEPTRVEVGDSKIYVLQNSSEFHDVRQDPSLFASLDIYNEDLRKNYEFALRPEFEMFMNIDPEVFTAYREARADFTSVQRELIRTKKNQEELRVNVDFARAALSSQDPNADVRRQNQINFDIANASYANSVSTIKDLERKLQEKQRNKDKAEEKLTNSYNTYFLLDEIKLRQKKETDQFEEDFQNDVIELTQLQNDIQTKEANVAQIQNETKILQQALITRQRQIEQEFTLTPGQQFFLQQQALAKASNDPTARDQFKSLKQQTLQDLTQRVNADIRYIEIKQLLQTEALKLIDSQTLLMQLNQQLLQKENDFRLTYNVSMDVNLKISNNFSSILSNFTKTIPEKQDVEIASWHASIKAFYESVYNKEFRFSVAELKEKSEAFRTFIKSERQLRLKTEKIVEEINFQIQNNIETAEEEESFVEDDVDEQIQTSRLSQSELENRFDVWQNAVSTNAVDVFLKQRVDEAFAPYKNSFDDSGFSGAPITADITTLRRLQQADRGHIASTKRFLLMPVVSEEIQTIVATKTFSTSEDRLASIAEYYALKFGNKQQKGLFTKELNEARKLSQRPPESEIVYDEQFFPRFVQYENPADVSDKRYHYFYFGHAQFLRNGSIQVNGERISKERPKDFRVELDRLELSSNLLPYNPPWFLVEANEERRLKISQILKDRLPKRLTSEEAKNIFEAEQQTKIERRISLRKSIQDVSKNEDTIRKILHAFLSASNKAQFQVLSQNENVTPDETSPLDVFVCKCILASVAGVSQFLSQEVDVKGYFLNGQRYLVQNELPMPSKLWTFQNLVFDSNASLVDQKMITLKESKSATVPKVSEDDYKSVQMFGNFVFDRKCSESRMSFYDALLCAASPMYQRLEISIQKTQTETSISERIISQGRHDVFLKTAFELIFHQKKFPMDNFVQSTLSELFEDTSQTVNENGVLDFQTHLRMQDTADPSEFFAQESSREVAKRPVVATEAPSEAPVRTTRSKVPDLKIEDEKTIQSAPFQNESMKDFSTRQFCRTSVRVRENFTQEELIQQNAAVKAENGSIVPMVISPLGMYYAKPQDLKNPYFVNVHNIQNVQSILKVFRLNAVLVQYQNDPSFDPKTTCRKRFVVLDAKLPWIVLFQYSADIPYKSFSMKDPETANVDRSSFKGNYFCCMVQPPSADNLSYRSIFSTDDISRLCGLDAETWEVLINQAWKPVFEDPWRLVFQRQRFKFVRGIGQTSFTENLNYHAESLIENSDAVILKRWDKDMYLDVCAVRTERYVKMIFENMQDLAVEPYRLVPCDRQGVRTDTNFASMFGFYAAFMDCQQYGIPFLTSATENLRWKEIASFTSYAKAIQQDLLLWNDDATSDVRKQFDLLVATQYFQIQNLIVLVRVRKVDVWEEYYVDLAKSNRYFREVIRIIVFQKDFIMSQTTVSTTEENFASFSRVLANSRPLGSLFDFALAANVVVGFDVTEDIRAQIKKHSEKYFSAMPPPPPPPEF